MMTLKELKSIQLEAKGRNAYKAESVDTYMDMVENLVEELYAANAELEEKMTILADKLEEYIAREDSITETLLSAQKVRDSIINDANAQAADIIAISQREAKDTIDDIRASIREEQQHYIALQKEVSDFKTRVLSLYKTHLDSISEIPNFEHESENADSESAEYSAAVAAEEVTETELGFAFRGEPEVSDESEEGFKITF